MDCKFYYFKTENKCILTLKKDDINLEQLETDKKTLIIDLTTKNVTNLYDFFVNNTIEQILNGKEIINIDYSEIEEFDFFKEAPFTELILLINQSLKKCNETIEACTKE